MSAAGDFACCVAHFADDISIFKMLHKLKKKVNISFVSLVEHHTGHTGLEKQDSSLLTSGVNKGEIQGQRHQQKAIS